MSLPDSFIVIIVNLNLKIDTEECIKSLLASGIAIHQIIVVDNGSTDGSMAYFMKVFGDELVLVDAIENRGYASGLNLGIKKGIELGADWFFLMNNDTIVDEMFYKALLEGIKRNPETLIFGPMILYYSDPMRIWYLGDNLIGSTLITKNNYRGKIDTGIYPDSIKVDFVHGCGMLVNRIIFNKIGYFDDWSIIYGEEIDFIWRARLEGFKPIGLPRAKMWHKISTIMNKQKPRTRYLRIRNQIRFYRKYSTGLNKFIMFLYSIFRSLYLVVNDLLSRNSGLFYPLVRAWIDGWFGKSSKENI